MSTMSQSDALALPPPGEVVRIPAELYDRLVEQGDFDEDQSIELTLDGRTFGRIAVADLLPQRS